MERNSEVMENRLIDAATATARSSTMTVKMDALLLSVSFVDIRISSHMVVSQAGAISCRVYDSPNSISHELGFLHLDVVPTILRDDLLRIVRAPRQGRLRLAV